MRKLAIIGGGASGLAAAVTAARKLRACGLSVGERSDVDVAVYEADERVGRSILATGNGRCNFSNARVDAKVYRNAEFVGAALRELAEQQAGRRGKASGRVHEENPVHEFFADVGLVWWEEGEGRLYPLANKATSVLDVLRRAASDAGVREVCGREAVRVDAPGSVRRDGERFHVRFADGSIEHVDAVVVAVGGRTVERMALPEELACAPGRPVLGPLRTHNQLTKQLNNIRVRCTVELVQADGTQKVREQGELLFRDYGVSGIAVFNLSRFAQPGDVLRVDLLPFVAASDAESFLFARRKRMAAGGKPLSAEAFAQGLLLPSVATCVLHEAGLNPRKPFEKADVPVLARTLKALPLEVLGIGDARQCQVWRGGLAVEAFDPHTCEARTMRGLFATGEALDVDAPCGGYNLHWAWASGMLAGRAAAAQLAKGCAHA